MSSCAVRIRPAAQSHSGRSLEQAESIVRSLVPGAAVSGLDVEFLLDFPLAFSELEDLAKFLVEGAAEDDVIFIEANFLTQEAARSYQVLDSLVSGLLAQVAVLEAGCKLAVSMRELPNRVDQIHDLLSSNDLEGRLAIVDDLGGHLGDTDLAARLAECLARKPTQEDRVEKAILRHRGVFRRAGSGRVNNYLFYYEALPEASSYFQQRLVDALNHMRPDVVITDTSTSGAWFESMVQAACVQLQTIHSATLTSADVGQWLAYKDGTLPEPQRSRIQEASVVLSRPKSTLAIVVPAYASGRSLTRALEVIGSPELGRCTAIAVFADKAVALEPDPLPGMQGIAHQMYGGRRMDVHCIYQAELGTLDRGDWLVAAAEALSEVRDLPIEQVDRGNLDHVALWSLFAECGVQLERVPAGGRVPKRHFPDLARLGAWDAHWLAEAAVANILDLVPESNRAALLVVIPEEENGTPPISRALREKCRVAVLPVPRPIIEGEQAVTDVIAEKLRRHTADTIAVLDESTVTHRSLERLSRLVESTIRIPPDLVGAVLDVSWEPPSPDLKFFSLARWSALMEGPGT